MFESVAGPAENLMALLLPLYRNVEFAYAIAGCIGVAALFLAVVAILGHITRRSALMLVISRLTGFVRFTPGAGRAGSATAEEIAFASRFSEIDSVMSRPGLFRAGVTDAWARFRHTLTLEGAPPVRASARPAQFFFAACPPPTWLGFAANLFVGFGLLATFVGLVAALSFASEGMQSADAATMQNALRDLLFAASSKFVTSIAGVGASIVLRLVERLLTIDLRGRLEALSAILERGVRIETDVSAALLHARLERLANVIERATGAEPAAAPAAFADVKESVG
ncbi:hypothetical protein GC169_09510 [bacterium]|nr:hypothetical protein [bacterium]